LMERRERFAGRLKVISMLAKCTMLYLVVPHQITTTFGAMALSGVKAAEEALRVFDGRKKQCSA